MKVASLVLAAVAVVVPCAAAFAPSPPNSGAPPSNSLSASTDSSSEAVTLVGEVDYDALASASTFPHSAETLINRAKALLNPDILLGQKDDGACLSDDFEFVAAVVGPIGKDEYLGALSNFKLEESFDIEPNFFGFSVDPIQRNRVWFFNRQTATHVAPFLGAEPKTDDKEANELILPPQAYHIDLDEDLKMKEFGFYTVDRRQGNTGGLGGAFAYMYGVGRPLPIPECQPYKRSFRFRLLSFVGGLAQKLSRNKKEE